LVLYEVPSGWSKQMKGEKVARAMEVYIVSSMRPLVLKRALSE